MSLDVQFRMQRATLFDVFGGYYTSVVYEVHSACKKFLHPFQSSCTQAAGLM